MKKKVVILTIISNLIVIAGTILFFLFILKQKHSQILIHKLTWLSFIELLFITSASIILFHRKMQGIGKALSMLFTICMTAIEVYTLLFAPAQFNINTQQIFMMNLLLFEYGAHIIIFFIIFTKMCEPPLIVSVPLLNFIVMAITYLLFFINFKQKNSLYQYNLIYTLAVELIFLTFFTITIVNHKISKIRKMIILFPLLSLSLLQCMVLFFPKYFSKIILIRNMSPVMSAILLVLFCIEILYFLTIYFQFNNITLPVRLVFCNLVGLSFTTAIFIILIRSKIRFSFFQISSAYVMALLFISYFNLFFSTIKISKIQRLLVLLSLPIFLVAKYSIIFVFLKPFKKTGNSLILIIISIVIVIAEIVLYTLLYLSNRKQNKKITGDESRTSGTKPPFRAYKGSSKYIFVSYAHKNMRKVFHILHQLYKSGYNIWYDEGIEPGTEWPEIIGKAIMNCDQFLVFISGESVRSRNVRNEVNFAFNHHKKMLVVYLENTPLSHGLELQIGTVQSIKKFTMNEKEFLLTVKKSLEK